MITRVPEYYKFFHCIADKCTHNCCVGWEIDIDEDTYKKYIELDGNLGERIRKSIDDQDTPHFILDKNDRCPFLNANGLCDIISDRGEELLCDICRMHPRFINEYTNFCEMGIGLSCEEAARIVLGSKARFNLVPLDGDAAIDEDEAWFFLQRGHIFAVLSDQSISFFDRLAVLCCEYEIDIRDFELTRLRDIYLSLERLDESWGELLGDLNNKICIDDSLFGGFEMEFQQLCCYFIFRHSYEALFDGDMSSKVRFAVAGTVLVAALLNLCDNKSFEVLCDISRMFSTEVEYSTENTQTLFDIL